MKCDDCGLEHMEVVGVSQIDGLKRCLRLLRTKLADQAQQDGEIIKSREAEITRLNTEMEYLRRKLDDADRLAVRLRARAEKAERVDAKPTPTASYWMIEAISDGPARWWSTLLGWCADAASADHYATKTDAEKAMHAKILAGVLTHEPNAALMKVTEHIDMPPEPRKETR